MSSNTKPDDLHPDTNSKKVCITLTLLQLWSNLLFTKPYLVLKFTKNLKIRYIDIVIGFLYGISDKYIYVIQL